jgi:zinc protease
VELIEAGERLGATLHVDASWDAFSASVEVAASRLGAALELLAELSSGPRSRPVGRRASARRASQRPAPGQGRSAPARGSGFHRHDLHGRLAVRRSAGGDEETVPRLTPDVLRDVHRTVLAPSQAAIVIGGDLSGLDVPRMVEEALGSFGGDGLEPAGCGPRRVGAASRVGRRSSDRPLLPRPGSVQTELRIGHVGLARRVPDFHAVQVMAAILGGLFNSRSR